MTDPFLVGTSGWTYDDWRGSFYPEKLAKSRWLEYYTTQFPTVEINATFYRTFGETTYQKWRERAPNGFKYVLKVPRLITHLKQLVNVEEEIRAFWGPATVLGDKLGLVLLQVSPQTKYDPERLRQAFMAFEDPKRVAVEFRNQDWMVNEIRDLLADCGATYVSVDSPKDRPVDWVTGEVGYIRLHGRGKWYMYDYNQEELREIAAVARRMVENGAKTVYIFFNNDYHANAPRNAKTIMEFLRS